MDELDIDTGIQVIDAYSKFGFNDEIELSVGNRSRVVFCKKFPQMEVVWSFSTTTNYKSPLGTPFS